MTTAPGPKGSPRQAAILGGNRIPFARSNKEYSDASNQDMLTAALDGLVSRFGLQGETLGEAAGGAVLKQSRDFNLVRESVLGSALAGDTPAIDMQAACGTGLAACVYVANKIALGQIESGIGGGVDTTSQAPIEVNEDLRQVLLEFNRTPDLPGRLKLLGHLRPGQIVPNIPRNEEPRTGLSMGDHQAISAKKWGITREEQDELTVRSHVNLAAAYDRGFFDDLMTPYLGLERDGNLRGDSTVEKLAKLKPVFGGTEEEGATMTAANSTPLTDGASAVLIASDEWAAEHDFPVLAHLVDAEAGAVDFVGGEEGLLAAPIYAVPRLLERNGLSLQDFDFYEIHEAFASQVLMTLKAWEDPAFSKQQLGRDEPLGEIDRDKLNVNGSSLATGHPFAATGGRIVATLAKELSQMKLGAGATGRGLISVCAAGGQGITAILERKG
jgi:acetyl-CoA C-acetyltransferase